MNAREVTNTLGGRWSNGKGIAKCPAHDDRKPSLSIAERNGRVVVKCHAKCEQGKVLAALKAKGIIFTGKAPVAAEVVEEEKANEMPWREMLSAAGHYDKTTKKYVRPDRSKIAEYLKGRGIEKLPANLLWDEKAREIVVAIVSSVTGKAQGVQITALKRVQGGWKRGQRLFHGEAKGGVVKFGPKDGKVLVTAEGLETALSVMQVTGLRTWAALSAGNMQSITIPADIEKLIIAADHDEPGRKAAESLAERVARSGITVQIAMPKREGRDWNDVLQRGDDPKQMKRAILNAPVIEAPEGLVTLTAEQLLAMPEVERVWLVQPWLPVQGLAMIHGFRGVGKSYITMGLAYAVAIGRDFLRWRMPNPLGVLYVDGELPLRDVQHRLRQLQSYFGQSAGDRLKFITPDAQGGQPMPDLGTEEGQQELDSKIDDSIQLIVIDNLSTLVRTGEENSADSWTVVQNWLLRHRAAGRSVLLVHHQGKGKQMRGSTNKEGVLDESIGLYRPVDYQPEQGLRVELQYGKGRGLYGEDARSFVVKLSTDKQGRMKWITEPVEQSKIETVASYLNDGWRQKDIAKELSLTAGRVSQLSKEAREKGLLKFDPKPASRDADAADDSDIEDEDAEEEVA